MVCIPKPCWKDEEKRKTGIKKKTLTNEEIEKEEEEKKTWEEKKRVYIALTGGSSIRRNGHGRDRKPQCGHDRIQNHSSRGIGGTGDAVIDRDPRCWALDEVPGWRAM